MQNGPVDKFTALTATIFVTISVFMSRAHFRAPGTDPGGPGPTLGGVWEVSTTTEKLSIVFSHLQKFPENADFTMGF